MNKINLIWRNIYSLYIVLNKKFNIVFFSENKIYQKYYQPLIFKLLKNNYEIFYLCCDPEDIIEHPKCTNLYIGRGMLMIIILFIVKANKFITTTTNLGNSIFLKSKFVREYYYIFHSTVSVHRAYSKGAFNNFDKIFCNSPQQIKEIRKIEDSYKIKQKKLLKSGYLLFDQIEKFKNLKNQESELCQNNILIAPSWNYSKKNFLNYDLINLINKLLNIKEKVILRLHPENYKRDVSQILKIRNLFASNQNFTEDLNDNFFQNIKRSKILITDNSGIFIEYMVFQKKPVIFFDQFSKVHNHEFQSLNLNCFEDEIKAKFGFRCQRNDINNIKQIINNAILNFDSNKIDDFMKNKFFNFGNSCNFFFNEIKEIENDIN